MSGDTAVSLIWAIGALVLVGSALIARRLPWDRTWKMAAIWIAIFTIALMIASYLT
jgi:aspartyl protease family protein